MKAIVCALLAAGGMHVTTAGVLQECAAGAADASRIVICVRREREAATEDMLEQVLGVEQAIDAKGADESARGRAALRQSQRAFERYVLEHCNGLQPLVAGAGEAAGLACETDLLRQRASALEALQIATDRI